MEELNVLDLFSGIGGFSLGLERTGGFKTVAFCEIEKFPRRVLHKHWPGVPCYHDVKTLCADTLSRDGITVDVITGGFPCQDVSVAGRQAGIGEGTRSGLWSEIVRLIDELRPEFVLLENVANLLAGPSDKRGAWFGRVLGDLAECGYDAEWENIPAAAVGAPHRRERVWIVAYPQSERQRKEGGLVTRSSIGVACASSASKNVADANNARLQGRSKAGNTQEVGAGGYQLFERCRNYSRSAWPVEPDVGGGIDGFSAWLDRLDLSDAHKLIITYANEEKARPREILRTLRDSVCSLNDWRAAGGSGSISASAVLFSYLCKLKKADFDEARLQLEGAQASENQLRSLRSSKKPSGSSRRPEYSEQSAKQYSNSLQALSRLLAHYAEKAWIRYRRSNAAPVLSFECGIARVANGIPDRSHRLKGLGNAVVPQIPELIGNAILDAIRESGAA